jgi:hypothetical protein
VIIIAQPADVKRVKQNEPLSELSPAEVERAAAQDNYAKIVGSTLVKHYPGIEWKVTIRLGKSGGIAYVQVPRISSQFGMVVHLSDTAFELEEEARLGGGELLERFGITRNAAGAEADLRRLRRDFRGEAIGAAQGEQT